MRLIHPGFDIESYQDGMQILKNIERAGRTCYKSEDKITDDSAKKFVKGLIKSGHESVLEHEKVTARVVCSRSVSHRFVRHRIASYSQESTRWINYGKKGECTFIIPTWSSLGEGTYNYEDACNVGSKDSIWLEATLDSEHAYLELLKEGLKPEEAQGVLTHDLKTEIVMTMNMRAWRHFFKERTPKCAGEQVRQLSLPMLAAFGVLYPVLFEDIIEGLILNR